MDADDLCARRVGTVLCDKWTLERLLGIGGMAAVYAARHRIGRLDAIKILHAEFARSDVIRARFEQEAHVLNRFHHPGAVEVRDLATTEDGAPFLVMELLEGQALSAHVRESPPSVDEVLRIADETLDVLAAAHEQKIIHRDIKPDNLFVLASGAIKVLDFGIAQVRSGEGALKTKTGTTLGTVAYMPQEQVRGLDIDVRADVYGVGATMYRLLVGRCVHTADSDVELLMQVMSEPAPRLAAVLPALRADVARIVDRALAFDRDARYPDARSMQADVRAARRETSPAIAAPLPPQSSVPTRTPQQLGGAATVAATPASALLAEAAPVSRQATRASDAPVPAAAHPTRVSAGVPAPPPSLPSGVSVASSGPALPTHEPVKWGGVPLLWLAAAGVLLFLVGALLVAVLALSDRGNSAVVPPSAATIEPRAPPSASRMPPPDDEDRPHEEHPPPHEPHGPPPPPHGKHKH